MKKIALLLTALPFMACSNDDSKPVSASADRTVETTELTGFTPPSWILGTWAPDAVDANGQQYHFTFSIDNICSASAATNAICWKEAVQGLDAQNIDYVINEEVTPTSYTVGYVTNGVVESVQFTKLADNKINVFVPNGASPQGVTGELVKQ